MSNLEVRYRFLNVRELELNEPPNLCLTDTAEKSKVSYWKVTVLTSGKRKTSLGLGYNKFSEATNNRRWELVVVA